MVSEGQGSYSREDQPRGELGGPKGIAGAFQSPYDRPMDRRAIKLTVPTEERDEIEALAESEGLSVTEVARLLVIEALEARREKGD